MGPFLVGRMQFRFFNITIDYFTKWVEAEPVATIIEAKIRSFVWKNIVCRFGIPNTIISDNGKQFDNPKFRKFCKDLGTKEPLLFSKTPSSEWSNRSDKKKFAKNDQNLAFGAKGKWLEELPNILWAYKTTTRAPTGETSFKLTFGIEIVILVEVGLTSIQVKAYEEQRNQ